MRAAITENGWALEAIGELEWLFLERLPGMAAGNDLADEQKRRLLPDPIGQGPSSAPLEEDEQDELAEFRADWDEFVRPELNLAFAEARDRVAADLKLVTESEDDPFEDDFDEDDLEEEGLGGGADGGGQMRAERVEEEEGEEKDEDLDTGVVADPEARYFRLEVPGEHSELWYNTLNQARLLMNEVYDLAGSEQNLFEQMLRQQLTEEEESAEANSDDDEEEAAVLPPDGMLLMLLAQYQFYSFIQSFLVERIMKP